MHKPRQARVRARFYQLSKCWADASRRGKKYLFSISILEYDLVGDYFMKQVYSIGHSNHNIDKFCELLVKDEIECLIDVRSTPFSRYYPQYNQERLIRSLEAVNIKYIFLGNELGGRITDITCYKDGVIPSTKVGYALHLNYNNICTKEWFQKGIEKLLKIIEQGKSAIMCSEENPEKCHRELIIGRRLKELGYKVNNIRTKESNNDQLGLF